MWKVKQENRSSLFQWTIFRESDIFQPQNLILMTEICSCRDPQILKTIAQVHIKYCI